jgi:hypothetical protein
MYPAIFIAELVGAGVGAPTTIEAGCTGLEPNPPIYVKEGTFLGGLNCIQWKNERLMAYVARHNLSCIVTTVVEKAIYFARAKIRCSRAAFCC